MDKMDFNVESYTRNELMNLFKLPDVYDEDILESSVNKKKTMVSENGDMTSFNKNRVIGFLDNARQVLLKGVAVNPNLFDLNSTPVNPQSGNHDVQIRPPAPYVDTYPSEYFPGTINPLARKINTEYLNVDSQFRENYHTTYSSNFHISLPFNIKNVVSMQLGSIELPKSYYAVSEQYKNNVFTVTFGGDTKLVVIPNGSYSHTDIISTINAILFAETTDIKFVRFEVVPQYINGNGPTRVFVDPAYVGPGTTITLNFLPSSSYTCAQLAFGWMLGFRRPLYEEQAEYISEGPISICGPKYMYLVVDDFNTSSPNSFHAAFTASVMNRNILAKVNIPQENTANTVDTVLMNSINPLVSSIRRYYGPVTLGKMQIQILDEYGRIVNFNNMDFSFCLTLQTAYDI